MAAARTGTAARATKTATSKTTRTTKTSKSSKTTKPAKRSEPAKPVRLPKVAKAARAGEPESRLALVRRARRIDRVLAETYPNAHCELDFANPFELLVATILSAQTTDKMVNQVTPALFAKYPTPADLAAANPEDVERMVSRTGFFRNKTRSIIGMSTAVCEQFGGEVPGRLKDLVTLPGVGRKTANVVLGNAFGVPGITVDTHFQRLSRRFGWTTETDPVKIETAVGELIPRKDWTMLSHRLIWHGRRCCHARRPACGACPVAELCPAYGEGPTDPKVAEKLLRNPSQLAPESVPEGS